MGLLWLTQSTRASALVACRWVARVAFGAAAFGSAGRALCSQQHPSGRIAMNEGAEVPSPGPAIITYRYLRIAMTLSVVFMLVAVAIERFGNSDSFKPSLSDYFYSPARTVFTGALIVIGICMIVLKGNTPREDLWLNVAGMVAPVVAFVPVRQRGRPFPEAIADGVTNNMWAFILTGALALIVAAAVLAMTGGSTAYRRQETGLPGLGALIGWGLVIAVAVWLHSDRGSFDGKAHYASAIVLFAIIGIVVVINAVDFQRVRDGKEAWKHRSVGAKAARVSRNRYGVIAALMVVAVVAAAALASGGWDYYILFVEVALIALFAAFWVLQTAELWQTGSRPVPADGPRKVVAQT
jgi:hypothetical protein